MKTPPASFFLKKAANLKGGGKEAGRVVVGSVTMDQIREIPQAKMPDLNTNDLDQAARIIMGSARSMGLAVKE